LRIHTSIQTSAAGKVAQSVNMGSHMTAKSDNISSRTHFTV